MSAMIDSQADRHDSSERFYTAAELARFAFASVGTNVKIDRSTIIVNPAGLSIGDETRIDAFGIITAVGSGVSLGRNVHLAAGVYVFGGGGVSIGDFTGISSRTVIYSTNDDYSGLHMTGPTLPETYTNVAKAPVAIGRHVVVGAGSVVLPGVTIGDGAATGALSLVNRDVAAFSIVGGVPARHLKERARDLLDLEALYLKKKG